MSQKVKFGSKIGLIAATVGSAVGLGNIWRFPAETQANGGAVFLLLYIACVFILGIPVMTAEFSLGRGGNSDATGAFRNVTPDKKGWWLVGALAILASYLILSFYMVVSGWTLEYMIQSLTGNLYAPTPEASIATVAGEEALFSQKMASYVTGTYRPLVMTFIMIAANLVVLLKGVQKGIEKMSNIMMPLLFVLLLVFCIVSLTLPKAADGIAFFLKPDFSAMTPKTVVNALGQAFFSLSLAMGILVTYSSYYPADTKLTRTAVTVSLLDLGTAILMGLIIFPAVMTFGLADHNLAGSALVFITLPEIFAQMGGTLFWSTLFFLLLSVAAFTSTISLAEVSVAFMECHFRMSRKRAVVTVVTPLFLLSSICSLSVGPWSDFKIMGMTIFDFLDTMATNIMLPVGGILLCIYMGWVAPRSFFRNELTNNGTLTSHAFWLIAFIVKWVAPALIALVLIGQFI
ncbi:MULTISPECIES: sodium-dependent transporter [Duncaniella]|jgi:NSS family neurotransmitter:Na+ symporter|uniref:sodium-dependent transporter n=2 Tax=Muribaculaceae TaxID=2005473 RepID=UPI000E85C6CB|nr:MULTISPECIES: sodium-dependent transporter [Duncaniella]MBJ2190665.1 sodium-dependent transporter [Muribaculaceae bacterium]MCX4285249.1 sodium-dependent transporter [Duncaniella dubosii]HBN62823.1 sodium-dependent transporter [Porphyromonadaceae bacterium]